jgi:CRISPR-associated protein Csm4
MAWRLYRLDFSRTHFGAGSLESSGRSLSADTLFSALAIEALALGGEPQLTQLYRAVANGTLRLSDAAPYVGDELLLPKPMLQVRAADTESDTKKTFKKIQFVPFSLFDSFVRGECDKDCAERILEVQASVGSGQIEDKVFVRNGKEDAEPYRVGVFSFAADAGLWVLGGGTESELSMVDELLTSLALVGVGGERSSGLGQFRLSVTAAPHELEDHVVAATSKQEAPCSRAMLLSVALPSEDELTDCLAGATYKLVKRSGFVASQTYAASLLRKRDLYKFASGSVFTSIFDGIVADVSQDGNHPVHSYAKALWFDLREVA